jgi:dihydrofolate synthase/folylpolyglutamate synthase
VGATLYYQGRDFSYRRENDKEWIWRSKTQTRGPLPLPKLDSENVATALMGVELLGDFMTTTKQAIFQAISYTDLPGRFQTQHEELTTIFDVAHNVNACQNLAKKIRQNYSGKKINIVVGMLKDKDIEQCLSLFIDMTDRWYVGNLMVERGADAERLRAYLALRGVREVHKCATIKEAYTQCYEEAEAGSVVLVFGSFLTVAEAMQVNRKRALPVTA